MRDKQKARNVTPLRAKVVKSLALDGFT